MLLQTLDKGAFVLIFWFQSQVLFYLLWCTQKQVWLAGSLHLFSFPSLSLCHVNCYCLLPQIAWEVCQMNRSAAAPLSSMDLYTTQHAWWPVIIQTNTPRPRAISACTKLDRCMLTVSAHCTSFFVCVCVSHSLSFSLHFFFLYSHFLIKQNISPLDVTRTDSCAGGRGENQPQDMSKSEISSPKIRWETWVSVKGGKEKERERREGAQRGESVREARPPLASYCKSGPWMTKGYTSGSSFLESKVQWYLYNNTVSFQHPPVTE